MTFLIVLARALANTGTPSHRLEETLTACSKRLGVSAQFFAMPTGIFAAMDVRGEQRTYMMRLDSAETHLERLTDLDRVVSDVLSGRTGPEQAEAAVMEIVSRPPRYSVPLTLVCFAASSACMARFFGGGWREIVASTLIGFVVGVVIWLSSRSPQVSRLPEFAAGVISGAGAVALSWLFGAADTTTIMLAGLIALVPGLTLTMGLNELAVRHVVSGTARLVYSLTLLFALGFGVAVGQHIARSFIGEPDWGTLHLPQWTLILALAVMPLAVAVLFRAKPRDIPAIAAAVVFAFAGARGGTALLGPELGALLGAIVVGVGSNAYARFGRHAAAVPLLPGILVLVPGTIGLRSVASFMQQNAVSGAQGAFNMLVIAMAIAVGVLLSNALLPPARTL